MCQHQLFRSIMCAVSEVVLRLLGTAGIFLFSLCYGTALGVPEGNVRGSCGIPDWNFVDLLQVLLDLSYLLAGIIRGC